MADRYNLSKLFNVLFTRGLAAHLPPAGAVVVDTVDPGYCYSSLRRHAPLLQGAAFAVMDLLLARRTDVGARTLVWAQGRVHRQLRDRGAERLCAVLRRPGGGEAALGVYLLLF
jgi:NAD(P)-dependent dehydrogenase (short-subunit alcohol dehydrogenase family)